MKRLILWICCAAAPAWGAAYQRFELPNAAIVLYQAGQDRPAGVMGIRPPGVTRVANAVRRVVSGKGGSALVAFDVNVDILPDGAGFRLRFSPAPGAPFFDRAPVPREVHAGDLVLIDVLEQPGTGKRIFDWIKVGFNNTPMTLLPPPSDVPMVIDPGSDLTLNRAELINGGGAVISRTSETFSAKRLRVEAPGGAQFTLSSVAGPGFRLEAILYGAAPRPLLAFTDGELTYYMTSASAIVTQPGPVLLWIRKEGGEPARQTSPPQTAEFSALLRTLGMPPSTAAPGSASRGPSGLLKISIVK